MTITPSDGRSTPSVFSDLPTLKALARSRRTALFWQLLIGIVAVVVALGSVFVLNRSLARLDVAVEATREAEQRNAALGAENAALEEQRDGLTRAMPFLRRAHQAWARGELSAAAQAFNDALGEAPDDADTLSSLAQVYFAQNNPAEAARLQAEVLRVAGSHAVFIDHARLIGYRCAAGDDTRALEAYGAAPEGFAPWSIAASRAPATGEEMQRLIRACMQSAPQTGARWQSDVQPGRVVRSDGPQASIARDAPAASAAPSAEAAAEQERTAVADAMRVRIVYLHIRNEADRADAEVLAAELRRAGYRVPGIELVAAPRGYGANVRYYYEQQAEQSRAIADAVVNAARARGLAVWSEWRPQQRSLVGQYDRLPRDRVEVWLPERSPSRSRAQ